MSCLSKPPKTANVNIESYPIIGLVPNWSQLRGHCTLYESHHIYTNSPLHITLPTKKKKFIFSCRALATSQFFISRAASSMGVGWPPWVLHELGNPGQSGLSGLWLLLGDGDLGLWLLMVGGDLNGFDSFCSSGNFKSYNVSNFRSSSIDFGHVKKYWHFATSTFEKSVPFPRIEANNVSIGCAYDLSRSNERNGSRRRSLLAFHQWNAWIRWASFEVISGLGR